MLKGCVHAYNVIQHVLLVTSTMSLYRWLKPVPHSFLPSCDEATSSSNKEVLKESNRSESEVEGITRKRGKYNHYDDEVKAKVAKYICMPVKMVTRQQLSSLVQYGFYSIRGVVKTIMK